MKLNIPEEIIIPAFRDGTPIKAVTLRSVVASNRLVFDEKRQRDGYNWTSVGVIPFAPAGKSKRTLVALDELVEAFDKLPDDFVMTSERSRISKQNTSQHKEGCTIDDVANTLTDIKNLLSELVSRFCEDVIYYDEPTEAVETGSNISLVNLFAKYGVNDAEETLLGFHIATCPFCKSQNKSLNINQGKHYWHCFSCGESGDAVALISKMEGCTCNDAINKVRELEKTLKEQEN